MSKLEQIKYLIFAKLIALLIRLIGLTVKKRFLDENSIELSSYPIGSSLLVFWHDQQIAFALITNFLKSADPTRPLLCLASKHRDGQLVANVMIEYGVTTVSGSSSSGGLEALFLLKKQLVERSSLIAITPDGPRGPRHIAKRGVIKLAEITDVPIICAGIEIDSAWYFNSWDKLILPKPFSNITYRFKNFKAISVNSDRNKQMELAKELSYELEQLSKSR